MTFAFPRPRSPQSAKTSNHTSIACLKPLLLTSQRPNLIIHLGSKRPVLLLQIAPKRPLICLIPLANPGALSPHHNQRHPPFFFFLNRSSSSPLSYVSFSKVGSAPPFRAIRSPILSKNQHRAPPPRVCTRQPACKRSFSLFSLVFLTQAHLSEQWARGNVGLWKGGICCTFWPVYRRYEVSSNS